MTRFIDEYAPAEMPGFPCLSSPRTSTSIVQVDSGAEQANRRWEHPLRSFKLPEAVRTQQVYNGVHDHWLVMGGPAHTWPFRDPMDFASVPLETPNVEPPISAMDQVLGVGDGARFQFQISKTYTRGAHSYQRFIHLPIASTVLISVAGVDPAILDPPLTWAVSRPGGVVEFNLPPTPGQIVRAGFLFDCEVRIASDDAFDGIVRTWHVGGFADIDLMEVRPC